MFKHILFPTDGSASADVAATAALRFAKSIGARVTVLHVLTGGADERNGDRCLLAMQRAASEQGVVCEALSARHDDVCTAVVQAAFDRQCDLVAMSARGLNEAPQAPPGSQTLRVLTHSQVPVLVMR